MTVQTETSKLVTMNNVISPVTADALVFRCATTADIPAVFALYQSLVGTPYCAWTAEYPGLRHVADDVASGSLYVMQHRAELFAAGAVAHLDEHDPLQAWCGKQPCDLLRFGVARHYQGQGLGRDFLDRLCCAAANKQYDTMRILVSVANLPAIALYRATGAAYHGDTQAYGIQWHCFERTLQTPR